MIERRTRKTQKKNSLELRPIGVIRSRIKERRRAPRQGSEGAPDAWLEVRPFALQALDGLAVGDEIILVTWLHRAHRETLKVHPRSDPERRLTGVFATRSPDRPNPIGLHEVTVRRIAKNRLRIGPIEAIDGTPVIDIKPVLCEVQKGIKSAQPHSSRLRKNSANWPMRVQWSQFRRARCQSGVQNASGHLEFAENPTRFRG
jgi:tRNA-Thr(GGU) m(6)t(6)A37 methyltransferase TsaA